MAKLSIDNRAVTVPEGATLLEAARRLGIDVPTLCHRDGVPPQTSCLVCMVKLVESGRLVPACATAAEEGMRVESETDEVHHVRRTALELLLSDHLGDCLAPCDLACPANMDIPTMLRQIAAGKLREAIATVKRDIALPAVLGRICPAPCEKACRRRSIDAAVAICGLKRLVADVDLASELPYMPPCEPPSGKRVAVVGAGPTGLAAGYYLTQQGHACTIFEQSPRPGGRLLSETTDEQLPRDVLTAEIDTIVALGPDLRLNERIADKAAFERLRDEFDAVLIAAGASSREQAEAWGLDTTARGVEADKQTYQTPLSGTFAAGNAIRGKALVVRSVADGKEAAVSIGQWLGCEAVVGPSKPFNTRMGRLEEAELALFLEGASPGQRKEPSDTADGYTADEGAAEAARCLHCDCRKLDDCRLRKYAQQYGANPRRYAAERRPFAQDRHHAEVIHEPGKCIACGLCIEIARAAGEPLGLTFVGRGFDVRVAAPLDESLAAALSRVAAECIAACPTAALARKQREGEKSEIRSTKSETNSNTK